MYKTFLLVAIIVLVAACSSSEDKLPVYNPVDLNPKLVDHSLLNKSENHKVLDFTLINQNGEQITQADYENKIYVTDFFFVSCKTICLSMTDNMALLQSEFKDDDDVMFLSVSVTPETDSVEVLRKYASEKGVIDGKWNVSTGDKKHIFNLARKSYFAAVNEGDGGLQDFIHTPNFVLVDKKKQIRGVYDGTKDEEIERLIGDIRLLRGTMNGERGTMNGERGTMNGER